MVAADGLSRPELAERYGVSERVIQHWALEDGWEPIGMRGKWKVYDPAKTDAAVAARLVRETPAVVTAAGSKLLTDREIAEAYGLGASTIRSYVSKGQLGEPDAVRDGVKLYRADRIAPLMARRRRYTRKDDA